MNDIEANSTAHIEVDLEQNEYKARISAFINECSIPSGIKFIEVLDNNAITELAKIAKNDPETFKDLLENNMQIGETVVVIPLVIFQESINNIKSMQHFNSFYEDFYRLLSQIVPIYIIDTYTNFDSFKLTYKDEMTAIQNYIEIAKTSTENIEVIKSLRTATTLNDVEASFRSVGKDCGERFAFLYSHALIAEGRERVRFYSNEIQGVYRYWSAKLSKKTSLHKLILVKDSSDYKMHFKVLTLNKLFYETLVSFPELLDQKKFLLDTWRTGKYNNDYVGFIEDEELHHDQIDNTHFIEIIKDEHSKIYY